MHESRFHRKRSVAEAYASVTGRCPERVRGCGLYAYLVRPRPFTRQAVELLERRCAHNGFAPVHLPYRKLDNDLSRYIRSSPAARAQYIASSAIRRDPPTDDSLFIWPYFKWRYLFHPAHRYERQAMQSGQVVMLPPLGVAVRCSLLFIVGPLAIFRRRGISSPSTGGLGLYFAALGFGFMFIEISFIQRFVLFLGYPTYSPTVVLSALLVASGIRSLASQRLIVRAERSLVWALAGLLALGAVYTLGGAHVFEAFLVLFCRTLVAWRRLMRLGRIPERR